MKKSVEGAVEVKEGKETSKIECKLCDTGKPHLICIMAKDGNIHVHAPFNNRYLISQFVDAIILEQRKYKG